MDTGAGHRERGPARHLGPPVEGQSDQADPQRGRGGGLGQRVQALALTTPGPRIRPGERHPRQDQQETHQALTVSWSSRCEKYQAKDSSQSFMWTCWS